MAWGGQALSNTFSASDVVPEIDQGEAKRFYSHLLSQEASIVRKRKGAPNSPFPFTGHSPAERQGKGRPQGPPSLLQTPTKPLPTLLGFDSHLHPHLQNSLPLGIRCQLHFACQRSSLANFWHKLLHIVCINLQVGFKNPDSNYTGGHTTAFAVKSDFGESTPDLSSSAVGKSC